MKRRNDATFNMFACVAEGDCSLTSWDAFGIFIVNRRIHGYPHAQERSEALIKSVVCVTRYENMMFFILQNSTIEGRHYPISGS